jgi:hypothetical protein
MISLRFVAQTLLTSEQAHALPAGAGFNLDVISVTKARNNPGD